MVNKFFIPNLTDLTILLDNRELTYSLFEVSGDLDIVKLILFLLFLVIAIRVKKILIIDICGLHVRSLLCATLRFLRSF